MKGSDLSVGMTRREQILGMAFIPFYLFLFRVALRFIARNYYPTLGSDWLNLIFYLLCAVFIFAIFRSFLAGNLRRLKGAGHTLLQELLGSVLRYYTVALAFGVLVTILNNVTGSSFSNQNDAKLMEIYGGRLWELLPIAVLLAPFVEETIFRGLIFGNIRNRNRVLAYAVTAVCFSAVHVVDYILVLSPLELAISMVQYVPATVFLCRIYERTDSLFASMALHGTLNMISMLIMTYIFGG